MMPVVMVQVLLVAEIMLVEMKHTQQQQHCDQADHQPPDPIIHRIVLPGNSDAMGQQVIKRHAQHKT